MYWKKIVKYNKTKNIKGCGWRIMSNEITVKLKCSINEMQTILENKGFKQVKKYSLNDTYRKRQKSL